MEEPLYDGEKESQKEQYLWDEDEPNKRRDKWCNKNLKSNKRSRQDNIMAETIKAGGETNYKISSAK